MKKSTLITTIAMILMAILIFSLSSDQNKGVLNAKDVDPNNFTPVGVSR